MKALIFALLILPSLALAKVESNYTLTPNAGQHEVIPNVGLAVAIIEFEDNTKTESAGRHIGLQYYYGVNDTLAIGAEIAHSKSVSETRGPTILAATSTSKGFADPIFRIKGNLELDQLGLFYSAGYIPSVVEAKYNADTNEYSQSNGQNSYVLQTGLAMPLSEHILGAILDYQKNLKGTEKYTLNGVTTDFDVEESSSHILKLYFELEKQYHLTGAFIHQREFDLFHGFEVSARFETASKLEVIPQLTSLVPAHKEDFNAKDFNIFLINVSLRYLF
ncbi:MAG: outer membrane beta-barrel protein [Bdellovibrionota bacterium]